MNMGLQHSIGNPMGSIEMIDNLTISVVRQHIKKIMISNKEWTSEQKAENIIQLSVFDPKESTKLLGENNIDPAKFEFVFNTIYKNIDTLSAAISKNLPAHIYEDNNPKVIQCMLENSILSFSKNSRRKLKVKG